MTSGARVVRPRLDGRLPVFVLDSFEDMVAVWRCRVKDHDGSVQSTPERWAELPDDLLRFGKEPATRSY